MPCECVSSAIGCREFERIFASRTMDHSSVVGEAHATYRGGAPPAPLGRGHAQISGLHYLNASQDRICGAHARSDVRLVASGLSLCTAVRQSGPPLGQGGGHSRSVAYRAESSHHIDSHRRGTRTSAPASSPQLPKTRRARGVAGLTEAKAARARGRALALRLLAISGSAVAAIGAAVPRCRRRRVRHALCGGLSTNLNSDRGGA